MLFACQFCGGGLEPVLFGALFGAFGAYIYRLIGWVRSKFRRSA